MDDSFEKQEPRPLPECCGLHDGEADDLPVELPKLEVNFHSIRTEVIEQLDRLMEMLHSERVDQITQEIEAAERLLKQYHQIIAQRIHSESLDQDAQYELYSLKIDYLGRLQHTIDLYRARPQLAEIFAIPVDELQFPYLQEGGYIQQFWCEGAFLTLAKRRVEPAVHIAYLLLESIARNETLLHSWAKISPAHGESQRFTVNLPGAIASPASLAFLGKHQVSIRNALNLDEHQFLATVSRLSAGVPLWRTKLTIGELVGYVNPFSNSLLLNAIEGFQLYSAPTERSKLSQLIGAHSAQQVDNHLSGEACTHLDGALANKAFNLMPNFGDNFRPPGAALMGSFLYAVYERPVVVSFRDETVDNQTPVAIITGNRMGSGLFEEFRRWTHQSASKQRASVLCI